MGLDLLPMLPCAKKSDRSEACQLVVKLNVSKKKFGILPFSNAQFAKKSETKSSFDYCYTITKESFSISRNYSSVVLR
jgi:hypothetical protein